MIDKVDLLVHIGASSTRHDDENYRAQANTYLEFRGNIVNNLREVPPEISNGSHGDTTDINEFGINQYEPTTFLDDTQLAYDALDSQLVTSSLQIPSQVTIRTASQQSRSSQGHDSHSKSSKACTKQPTSRASSVQERQSSSNPSLEQFESSGDGYDAVESSPQLPVATSTPRKVPHTHPLSQSSYLKSPILDRARLKKKQRLDSVGGSDGLASSRIFSSHPRYVALPEQTGTGLAYVGDRPITSVEERISYENDGDNQMDHQSYETTSELPTSYSLSDITSESSRARNKASMSQRSASDPGPVRGDAKGAVKEPTSTALNVQRKVEVIEQQPAPTIVDPGTIASSASMQEHQKTHRVNAPASNNPSTAKPTLPQAEASPRSPPRTLFKTILPPSPTPAQNKLTSHLTPTLLQLASDSRIKDSYRPLSTVRPIRDLERGYWLIDTTLWPKEARSEFWKYLERAVGEGWCGWGVWCCRGEVEAEAEAEQADDGEDGRKGGENVMKVFCWGEVVKEIYLLLYVASKSRVRKAGLRWVDGRGEVVVRMREG